MVTREPSAANIDANSMPITPAPTIEDRRGIAASRSTMSSESRIVLPLKAIPGGCAGSEPVASTNFAAVTRRAAPAASVTRERVLVVEARGPVEQRDVVADELVADHGAFPLDDVARALREVFDRDLVLEPVAGAVDRPLAEAREVEDCLADRLRRDRAGVDAAPPTHAPPLDERDPPAELRRLDRRLLPGRARADDDEVEVVSRRLGHRVSPSRRARRGGARPLRAGTRGRAGPRSHPPRPPSSRA